MEFKKINLSIVVCLFLFSAVSVFAAESKVHNSCPKTEAFDKSVTVKKGDIFEFGHEGEITAEVVSIHPIRVYGQVKSLEGKGSVYLRFKGDRGSTSMTLTDGQVRNMPDVIIAMGKIDRMNKNVVLCLSEKSSYVSRKGSKFTTTTRTQAVSKNNFPNLMDFTTKRHLDRATWKTGLQKQGSGKMPSESKHMQRAAKSNAMKDAVGSKKNVVKTNQEALAKRMVSKSGKTYDFSKTYNSVKTTCASDWAKRMPRCKYSVVRQGLYQG